MNVLLFDESPQIRLMIQKNLIQFKQSMKIVSTNKISKIQEEYMKSNYDLIILDMDNLKELPAFNRVVRSKNSKTIIILITSNPTKKLYEKYLSLGIDYCLDKVSEFEQLLKTINELFTYKNEILYTV